MTLAIDSRPVGTILEGPCRMPFYTDLQEVFRSFGGREREYDWLISDLDCNTFPLEFQGQEHVWFMTGDVLSDLVFRQEPAVQFEWCVLSGLPRGTSVDLDELEAFPHANGNPDFWRGDPRIQLPGAAVELVCWDSGATLLITRDDVLTQRFRTHFPEARDLAQSNAACEAKD